MYIKIALIADEMLSFTRSFIDRDLIFEWDFCLSTSIEILPFRIFQLEVSLTDHKLNFLLTELSQTYDVEVYKKYMLFYE